MTTSTLSFAATLPPFYYANGYNANFSRTNISASGDLSLFTQTDAATGQQSTNVSSNIISNGISYAQNSASIIGNELTVSYTSTNAANAPEDSGVAADLLNTNINGGVEFSPQTVIRNGNFVTTVYETDASSSFDLSIENAAYSSGGGSSDKQITLKSIAIVGTSIIATYVITEGLANDVTTASEEPAATVVTSTQPSPDAAFNPLTFQTRGINSIGDLLGSSNGLSDAGTITDALENSLSAGRNNSPPVSNIVLAASLDPDSILTPDKTVQVTDFINIGQNAFPTSAQPNPLLDPAAGNNFGGSGDENPASQTGEPNIDTQQSGAVYNEGGSASSGTGISLGIYNAVSNASTSTIRGVGVNTVA
ncbi:MAG: hypothetical protein AB7H77_05955 [Bdellovibrionales bacterium]